ncbi:ParB N-terminal domain-containing protein [Tropheryma whipplei]|uniref:ParB N-terminal domain-containing protein n=1 Tax=Tropheryma whipplei TaxID=2039 RepID=UPI001F4CB7B7|nr:ParB N-terminal domain-containing protein [Tropheryma whipplei]
MTSRRSGLGKGLDDLTSSASADRGSIEAFFPSNSPFRFSGVINVPITDISPNPRQPRKVFDPDSLSELASSIKEVGFIQPIVVRKTKLGYVLVIGERRLRASQNGRAQSRTGHCKDPGQQGYAQAGAFRKYTPCRAKPD